MAEIYHLLHRQIPPHVREKYPVFCTFVDYYYRWLQARGFSDLRNITDIDFVNRAVSITENTVPVELFNGQIIVGENGARALVVGISDDGRLLIRYQTLDAKFKRGETVHIRRSKDDSDKSAAAVIDEVYTVPSVFMDEFSKLLDVDRIFGTDTNNIAQILKHIKELYRSKGTADALKYLLKVNRNVDAEVKYPWEQVLKPSDGKWEQLYAVTLKTDPEFLGREPKSAEQARFLEYVNRAYADFDLDHIETFHDSRYLRFYLTEDPSPYENQEVEIVGDNEVKYLGRVVGGYSSVHVIKGGRNWQVGQVFTIGGKPGWSTEDLSYDVVKRPWHSRNKTNPMGDPYSDYGESGSDTFLEHEEKPTICRVTVIDKDGAMVAAEIVQLGEYVSKNMNKEYVVSPLFFETGEEWEEEYKATVTFDFAFRHKEVGRWKDESGFLSYQDIRLQDSYYYQQFSYDIVSSENPDRYESLAQLLHPAGSKMFTTYVLDADLDLANSLDLEINFPFIALSLFDVARITEAIYKKVKKPFWDSIDNVHDDKPLLDFIKGIFDHSIAADLSGPFKVGKNMEDRALALEKSRIRQWRHMFDDVLPCEEIDFDHKKVLADYPSVGGFIGFNYRIDGFGDLALSRDLGKWKDKKSGGEQAFAFGHYTIKHGKAEYEFPITADYYRFTNRARTIETVLASDNRETKLGKPLSDSSAASDKVRVARVLLGKESSAPTDFLSMSLMKPFLDGVNTGDMTPVLGIGLNPSDRIHVSDGTVSATVPPTVSYDDDYDPYFVRIYEGKTNLSYSELGRSIKIDIMEKTE